MSAPSPTALPASPGGDRLMYGAVHLDVVDLDPTRERLAAQGRPLRLEGETLTTRDPSGSELRLAERVPAPPS